CGDRLCGSCSIRERSGRTHAERGHESLTRTRAAKDGKAHRETTICFQTRKDRTSLPREILYRASLWSKRTGLRSTRDHRSCCYSGRKAEPTSTSLRRRERPPGNLEGRSVRRGR